MIKVYTHSLGCPKNTVDTENILSGLKEHFYPVAEPGESDVVLINTCAFIRSAVEESLETIFEVAKDIESLSPRPLLVVTGCLVSRYGSGLGREIPEADMFVPIAKQADLPGRILHMLGCPVDKESPASRPGPFTGYAYLKISEGCNNRCAFCTIPSIRGRLRSRPEPEVLREAEHLIDQGALELVLVSQDSTAYGRDLGYRQGLARLAEKLAVLEGLLRIRIMYLYPSGLNERLLARLAELGPSFVPYFDVPLQHAHPEILKKMGRPFQHDPLEVLRRIRNYFPGAAIRSTLITGYPGEKEWHFQALLEFVRQARVQHLGVFPFYPEEGTRAAGFSGQVPDELKNERRRIIMQEQKKISREYLQSFVQESLDIMVDALHPEWPGLYTGRTWFQAPEVDGLTYISGPGVRPGKMVRAEIISSHDYDLEALV
ncbi:30S ribosomal protein S12 methylthiotransferase RimO [Desulfonatronospira sp.]|uniref:30S ribosomal protein S12 methylthiotransferase RimO n=1 Tax=Desulfonatronospira sp. TaxID=1962951 RepID=UPI0025BAD9D8|nr:30S ribosomal protein S12 methylthiotransferase RimO [Desulfonatronospira sp.]